MKLLSFPFRIDRVSGQAATVTVGSDQEAAEAIALLALTRPGERELCPGFGSRDPSYSRTVDLLAEVRTGLTLWGPDGVTVDQQDTYLDPDVGVLVSTFAFTREA